MTKTLQSLCTIHGGTSTNFTALINGTKDPVILEKYSTVLGANGTTCFDPALSIKALERAAHYGNQVNKLEYYTAINSSNSAKAIDGYNSLIKDYNCPYSKYYLAVYEIRSYKKGDKTEQVLKVINDFINSDATNVSYKYDINLKDKKGEILYDYYRIIDNTNSKILIDATRFGNADAYETLAIKSLEKFDYIGAINYAKSAIDIRKDSLIAHRVWAQALIAQDNGHSNKDAIKSHIEYAVSGHDVEALCLKSSMILAKHPIYNGTDFADGFTLLNKNLDAKCSIALQSKYRFLTDSDHKTAFKLAVDSLDQYYISLDIAIKGTYKILLEKHAANSHFVGQVQNAVSAVSDAIKYHVPGSDHVVVDCGYLKGLLRYDDKGGDTFKKDLKFNIKSEAADFYNTVSNLYIDDKSECIARDEGLYVKYSARAIELGDTNKAIELLGLYFAKSLYPNPDRNTSIEAGFKLSKLLVREFLIDYEQNKDFLDKVTFYQHVFSLFKGIDEKIDVYTDVMYIIDYSKEFAFPDALYLSGRIKSGLLDDINCVYQNFTLGIEQLEKAKSMNHTYADFELMKLDCMGKYDYNARYDDINKNESCDDRMLHIIGSPLDYGLRDDALKFIKF